MPQITFPIIATLCVNILDNQFISHFLQTVKQGTKLHLMTLTFFIAGTMSAHAQNSGLPEEPVVNIENHAAVIVPLKRPPAYLTLPQAPASINKPVARPDRRSLYPPSTANLTISYKNMYGEKPPHKEITYELQSGEGLTPLLIRGGFDPLIAREAVRLIAKHQNLQNLPIGFEVQVILSKVGLHFSKSMIRVALVNDIDLTLYNDENGIWKEYLSARPIKNFFVYALGDIQTSLYNAVQETEISDAIFNEMVQLLGFSVDFQREIRKGDSFSALFEAKRDLHSGEVDKDGKLFYISMTLSGKKLQYFRHTHLDGEEGWYSEKGRSVVRTLMRTPVNGARLSSGFGTRKHPILGYSKQHKGVDFAAPTGTPIMAAGNGVIEYAGRNGSYGNYVRIRHSGTYKTAYAHLHKINRGITKGARVQQGQIIGTIGSTGRSTGPHLHYEIIVDGRRTNPMTIKLPSGKPLPVEEELAFKKNVNEIMQKLQELGPNNRDDST